MNVKKGVKGFVSVPIEERFWTKVDKRGPDDCWPWKGTDDGHGYGLFWLNGKHRRATRVSWERHHNKSFPEGMDACHSCDNPKCVNPIHIWPGTAKDNAIDAKNKGRLKSHLFVVKIAGWQRKLTHCLRGHEFIEANTYITKDGRRSCRTCHRKSRAVYDQKQRAKI